MAIQIEIQEYHIQSLIDFYMNRLKMLRDEIAEREAEFKEINATIQKLKRTGEPPKPTPGGMANQGEYSERWSWLQKVRFAMEQKDKPLSTKDIADMLTYFEASLLMDRRRAIASISSILSTKSGDGKDFLRVASGPGDFLYIINPDKKERKEVVGQDEDDEEMPF